MEKTIYASNDFLIMPEENFINKSYPDYEKGYNYGNENEQIYRIKGEGEYLIMFAPVIIFNEGGTGAPFISYILDLQAINDIKAYVKNYVSPFLNKQKWLENERKHFNDFLFEELNSPYNEGKIDEFYPFEIDKETFNEIIGSKDILFENDFNAIFDELTKYYIEKELPEADEVINYFRLFYDIPVFKTNETGGKIIKLTIN